MRRALASLLSILTLQLSLVGGDHACEKHGRAAVLPSADAGAAHHHDTQRAQHRTDDHDGCRRSAPAECCIANASCGPVVGIATVVSMTGVTYIVQRVADAVDSRDVSRGSAPDTPPPRA